MLEQFKRFHGKLAFHSGQLIILCGENLASLCVMCILCVLPATVGYTATQPSSTKTVKVERQATKAKPVVKASAVVVTKPVEAIKKTDTKRYIPEKAYLYVQTVKDEQEKYFPTVPVPAYFGSLIEHESCISMTHSRCWSPTSRLKSAREEGAGLGQLTRAYRADGSIRFDIIQELKAKHKRDLAELSWDNVYTRPDLQIRGMILLHKGSWDLLYDVKDFGERLKFADAAYNGGLPGLQKERRACGMKADCNPQLWLGNVEETCLKSKKPLYGNRSACDINRHHVVDVTETRLPKYEELWLTLK